MTYFNFNDFYGIPSKIHSSTSNTTYADLVKNSLTASLRNSPTYFNAAGFTSSDIKAEIKNNNILHITGESEKYGTKLIKLAMLVPEDIDQKSIELKVENGMIIVTFEHKREESKTIKVK